MSEFKFFPEQVVWEITYACNMRCIHCGTSAGVPRSDELTTEESLALIDELADLGCRGLTLSGGEPLMRKDWPVLARRSKERGIGTFLITNGYMVTEDIARQFVDIGFGNIGVSFDGSRDVHNYIRQHKSSYERALNAMRHLRAAGQRFEAVTQVSRVNIDDLDHIYKDLVDVGASEWRIQMTTVTGRMQKDMVMDLELFERMIDKIMELKRDGRVPIDVGENIGYYGCKGSKLLDDVPYLGCYAGTRVAGICSNGDVKGCLSQQPEFVEGNIRESSFTRIWNDPTRFLYNRKFTRDTASGECRDCQFLPLCRGGCMTTSVSASGERANNPYCIYQIERKRGIEPTITEQMAELLAPFRAEHERVVVPDDQR